MNGLHALLVEGALDGRIGQIGLADALDRSGGIHYLVSEHSGESLPCLYLVVSHQLLYLFAHVVEGFLQGSLTEEHALGGQTEGEVAMTDGHAHEFGSDLQESLMSVDAHCYDDAGNGNDDKGCYEVMTI